MSELPSTLIDRLRASKQYWTAWCGLEAALAVRICQIYCNGNWGKLAQMLSAYMYVASKRDNVTMTASVVDAEVAKVVPRLRKAKGGSANPDSVGADAYRKGAKRDLQACGLLNFEIRPYNRASTAPTVYTFPALDTELSRQAMPLEDDMGDSRDSGTHVYSDTCGAIPAVTPVHAEQVPAVTPTLPEQIPGVTPTSLDNRLDRNIGSIEKGNSVPDDFTTWLAGLKCPSCGSNDIREKYVNYWTCNSCSYRFDVDGNVW